MKKNVILQLLLSLSLMAEITLTVEEEKNWQIQTDLSTLYRTQTKKLLSTHFV
jgi:hypothetical protein